MSISDPVSITARWIAAARAAESRRADRLFNDPFAESLAGQEGFELLRKMANAGQLPGRSAEPENPYLAIRTRFIDDLIGDAMANSSLRQVVLVAAGLDCRAYRLQFPAGTRLFELDRAEVLDFKERTLLKIGAHPACLRTPVPVDLTTSFRDALADHGFEREQPSFWVVEGLLPYLTEAQAGGVLAECALLASAESKLVSDMAGRSFLQSVWVKPFLRRLEEIRAPWRFATDQPEEFFAGFGWRAKARRPGEEGTSYGRWPYAVAPRGTPGIPQSFFVTAVREGTPGWDQAEE